MSLEVIPHSKIDFNKWDTAILNSKNPLVFAMSFYLNATCPTWDALIIDNYRVVFPLTRNRKWGLNYLYQPPFTPQLGTYGDYKMSDLHKVYDYLKNHFEYIDIEFNHKIKADKPYKIGTKRTFIIETKEPKFNTNTKRNIKKAENAGIEIHEVNNETEIKVLLKEHLLPWLSKELKIPNDHLLLFKKLIESANERKALKTFNAIDSNGQLKAFAFFIFNKNHAVYLKGMTISKRDSLGSMHKLMATAINYFGDKVAVFDFGGGNSKNLAEFYKGLGGKEKEYPTLKVNKLPLPLRLIKK
ncbi:MAG: hypothetical protein AB7O73_05325 [Bacteroidia bacterium]